MDFLIFHVYFWMNFLPFFLINGNNGLNFHLQTSSVDIFFLFSIFPTMENGAKSIMVNNHQVLMTMFFMLKFFYLGGGAVAICSLLPFYIFIILYFVLLFFDPFIFGIRCALLYSMLLFCVVFHIGFRYYIAMGCFHAFHNR